MTLKRLWTCVAVLACGGPVLASSHSDAPLIKQDPQANLTDVYAFIGGRNGDPANRVLNVVIAVRPFSEPGDGPHYDRFADDAIYSIHITNPTTGGQQMRYDFQFSPVSPLNGGTYRNLDTILSFGRGANAPNGTPVVGPITAVGSPTQNFVQTYSLTRTVGLGSRGTLIGSGLPTAPPNPGRRTTPLYNDANGRAMSGATSFAGLDLYTQQSISNLPTGETCAAGPREDGFYADVPGIFDLLDPRILAGGTGQAGGGVDGFKGFNVLSFGLQIPVSALSASGFTSPFFGQQTGVGVYASVSRPRVRITSGERGGPQGGPNASGGFVQVNRLANPLFNEVLVALRDKDNYNRSSPSRDAQFARYALNPELAVLVNATFGTNFQTTNRTDLQAIFLPDVIRVNTTTAPVRLAGQAGFSRLGFIGGDTTDGVSGGWPNGRRFGDDVVDVALTALASGPSYASITVIGDNVPANDLPYHQVFPYAATPHAGTFNRKDP